MARIRASGCNERSVSLCFVSTVDPGVFCSMTTWARDVKFAVTPVQRLQLAMVALTQKSLSAQYAWFSCGGSHVRVRG